MKYKNLISILSLGFFVILAVGSGSSEPVKEVVPGMSEFSACSTANLIIKRRLDGNQGAYRTAGIPCRAEAIGGNRIRIYGGYENVALARAGAGGARSYIAEGVVLDSGRSLRLETIQVIGVDSQQIPIDKAFR